MPKTRRDDGSLGDWSSTGTFLRKPSTGWLHEDRELSNQSSINYKIWYLGCIEVCQSMRTLQYNMRTQVTKEAIVRMAEVAGKLQHKKKKVPKQLNRLLGAVDTRWAGEVNLAVSAENLKISNATSDREIMNHSLPSISFASGGDGSTLDFIGYVAKDPVHERACHVFECVECSQYVLTTIGQAFELRYKMYLNSPQPEPMQIRSSVATGDSWMHQAEHTYEQRDTESEAAALPGETPLSPYSPSPRTGIYSDLPEFPNDVPPSPSPSPSSPSLPPLTITRPRVYSKLPGFPTLPEEEVPLSNGASRPWLDNPYDTIHADRGDRQRPHSSETGVYSEPGEVTASPAHEYSSHRMTIKQSPANPRNSDSIDLTPVPDHTNHVYSNSSVSNGIMSPVSQPKLPPPVPPAPVPKPRPAPRPLQKKPSGPPSPPSEAVYDQPLHLPPPRKGRGGATPNKLPPNDYDDPDALQAQSSGPMKPTRAGLYDDVSDVLGASKPKRRPPPAVPKAKEVGGRGKKGAPGPTYEDPNTIIRTNGVSGGVVPSSHQETPSNPRHSRSRTPPKFDDTIYAIRQDVGVENEGEGIDGGGGNMDPLAPLPQQQYFHGVISRVEAEALLEAEGEFLVRESGKMAGQFVLTGMSHEGPQHLLLMDKSGMVKSRDHQFDSVPHLVNYFTSREIPLIIGKSQVFLRAPVINAFPNRGTH